MSWPQHTFIVIPAYKAAAQLEKLLPDVLDYVPGNSIMVVDDASHDETPAICRRHAVGYAAHQVNKGKGAALATGFSRIMAREKHARWIITMDADGQHAPSDLEHFINAAEQGTADGICIGARLMKPGIMPPERILSNRLTSCILGLFCGTSIKDSQCGYRIYSTALLKRITIDYHRFEMESEVIMKAAFLGFPVTFIPIQTLYLEGPSHIAHAADTLRWIFAVLRIRMQRRRILHNGTSTEQVH